MATRVGKEGRGGDAGRSGKDQLRWWRGAVEEGGGQEAKWKAARGGAMAWDQAVEETGGERSAGLGVALGGCWPSDDDQRMFGEALPPCNLSHPTMIQRPRVFR